MPPFLPTSLLVRTLPLLTLPRIIHLQPPTRKMNCFCRTKDQDWQKHIQNNRKSAAIDTNLDKLPIYRSPLTSQSNKTNLEGSIFGWLFVWSVGCSMPCLKCLFSHGTPFHCDICWEKNSRQMLHDKTIIKTNLIFFSS